MILDAEQARARAREHIPTSKLVERIMQDILAKSNEGKFWLTYWPEGEDNYTIHHATESLCELGYVVTVYGNEEDGIVLCIDWEK